MQMTETLVKTIASNRSKKLLLAFLNFLGACLLLYPAFPNIPLLVIVSLAIATISLVIPVLSLGIALLLFSGYCFALHSVLGVLEFFLAVGLAFLDVKDRKELWIFLTLITPICVSLNALYLPIFLAIVLFKEKWEVTATVISFQVVFLSTFLGNYPWAYSEVKVPHYFAYIFKDFSGSLMYQLNAMNNYNSNWVSNFLLHNTLYFIIFLVAIKVIIVLTGKICHAEQKTRDKKPQELLGLAFAMGMVFLLSVGQAYIGTQKYYVLNALVYSIFSFVPVFAVSLLAGSIEKFHTYSELNSRSRDFTWDSIAGYEDIKEEIKEAILPYVDPETHKKIEEMNLSVVKGILLYGPTGVGKTLFARVIAGETKMNFISVKCSHFLSKWVGESEFQLKSVFAEARGKAPCVLFFDEIEAFLTARVNEGNSWLQTVITTFLAEMDGFEQLEDVLVIGATNYPNKIDPAVIRPGRFDKIIYIPHPDEEARKKIFKLYLKDKPVKEKIDYEQLVNHSERYTPADIHSIVAEAYRTSNYTAIRNEDILRLLKQNKATMTYKMLEIYNEFSVRYGRRKYIDKDIEAGSLKRLSWANVAGMEDVKSELKRYVELPVKNHEIYEQFRIKQSHGIMLFGPPGCGKTLLARVLADECRISFFQVKCSEILRAYTGESENNVQEVFRKAKENKPAIIFFDELDALAEKRGSSNTKVVEQLLMELDGTEELKNVYVVGATNRIDAVDEALLRPGRFDKMIFIGLPDYDSRKRLMELYLEDRAHEIDIEEAAHLMEGYTGAEIEYIVNRAAILTAEDYIKGNIRAIQMEDLRSAIESTPRSITVEDIERFENLSKKAR